MALLVGFIILKLKHKWHRWFIISGTTIALIILIFTSFFIMASSGKTLGWELFGVRIASVTSPQIETSSATRMMILPSILEMINKKPLLGEGEGATITFLNTNTHKYITTRHFDWGYLEMLAELGIFGTLALLSLIIFIIYKIIEKIKHAYDWHDFYVGSLAAIVSMLIINITTPALFHVFGIIFLVLILSIALKPTNIFEKLITSLYRIFNRVK